MDTDKVHLSEYLPEHVVKYHEWMKDADLLSATASEPLTLQEERKMQQEWAKSDDKQTFIIFFMSNIMVGDLNFFIDGNSAEINLMIAEKQYRRMGIAATALTMGMHWMVQHKGIQKFIAKIDADNFQSINFFKKLNFQQTGEVNIFNEILFEKTNIDHVKT